MSFGGLHIGGHLGGKKATSLSNAVAAFGEVAEGLSAIREASWDEIAPGEVHRSSRDHEHDDQGHGRHHRDTHHHRTRDDEERNTAPKKPQTKRAGSSGLFHRKKHSDHADPDIEDSTLGREGARTPADETGQDESTEQRPAHPRRRSLLRKVRPPSFRRSSTDDTVTARGSASEGSQTTTSRPQTKLVPSSGSVPRICEDQEPVEDSPSAHRTQNSHSHSHSYDGRGPSPGPDFLRPEAVTSVNFSNANGSVTPTRSVSPAPSSLSPALSISLASGSGHGHDQAGGLAALADTTSPNHSMVDLLKRKISDFGAKGRKGEVVA